MRKAFAILIFSIFLVSCAGTQQAMRDSWVGLTETDLIKSWGAPTRVAETDNTRVLTYDGNNVYGGVVVTNNVIIENGKIISIQCQSTDKWLNC